VTWAIDNRGYSQRRACGLIGMEPRVYRYRSTRPGDAGLRKRLRELAAERRRFGYRRLHLLLKREGVVVNWKKLYRLYRDERLTVRKRGGRKRALGTRAPMTIPQDANQRWSLDFVADTLIDGRRFRILCVIDDFNRECLATVVDNSLSGERVGRELDQIAERRGYPCMIVSDNGTELTSNAIRPGRRIARSSGTTSRRASQCRTASWRASSDGVRDQHSLDRIGGMWEGGFLAHRSHTRSVDGRNPRHRTGHPNSL
jgi:putative transposase